jgi:hypothetical protein
MEEVEEIRTATMAGIYAQQGHYRKAAEIYRYLLAQQPERTDIKAALVEIEAKADAASARRENLDQLLAEWIRLLISYRKIQYLKKFKQDLEHFQGGMK